MACRSFFFFLLRLGGYTGNKNSDKAKRDADIIYKKMQ